MGTRADFYVGKGKGAEWIGSVAFDGYRSGIVLTDGEDPSGYRKLHHDWPDGKHLFDSTTEQEFRERVAQYFANRTDATLPKMGWPWPWEDSGTSDCSYWFFDGQVWDAHCRGGITVHVYVPCGIDVPDDEADADALLAKREVIQFPDMSARKNVTLGPRSGLIVVRSG